MIGYFILSMLTPWVLGFAIMKAVLKRRYGWVIFALGGGFLLGWVVVFLLMNGYVYFGRLFNINEFLVVQWLIALPLLFFGRTKRCSIEELRLEKAPANMTYFISLLLGLLILFRLGIAFNSLINPLFSAESLSIGEAKAKLFYAYLGMPSLYPSDVPFWQFQETNSASIAATFSAENFAPLVQTYTALSWGAWANNVINLAWVGAGLSMALVVIGGLRYLGAKLLPTMITAYMVISLPLLDTAISYGSSAGIWTALSFLLATITLVIALNFQEKRLWLAFVLALLGTYFSQHSSLLFLPALVLVLPWMLWGGLRTVLLFTGVFVILLFLDYMSIWSISAAIMKLFNTETIALSNNAKLTSLIGESLVSKDNWHLTFFAGLSALLLLVKPTGQREYKGLQWIIFIALACFALILLSISFRNETALMLINGKINTIILFFAPVFCLLPVCVYHLVTKDDDTIP